MRDNNYKNNKSKTLYSVYVTNKACNLNCKYCATGHSEFMDSIPNINTWDFHRNNDILESSRNIYHSEILKIVGGGEIFLDPNLEKWICNEAKNYSFVFILTNGVAVDKNRLDKIAVMDNLYMGLSLDGHLYKMNQYRYPQNMIFNNVMNTFTNIGDRNIPMQINMVMHDTNCDNFFDYLEFLINSDYIITLHMSPVMQKNEEQAVSQSKKLWLNNLEKLLDLYEQYNSILLPKAYIKHLIDYYKNNSKRDLQCYIPFYMVQLFSSGEFTACPIIWNKNIGNVCDYQKCLFTEDIYSLLCRSGKHPFFCRKCISSYDILSLYVEGKISDDEMKKLPLFSKDSVMERIHEIKSFIKGGGAWNLEI